MAETVPDTEAESAEHKRAVPGLLVIFSEGNPRYHPIVARRGQPILLGREGFGGLTLGDPKMSTRHAEVTWSSGFEVRDLGSRNGTYLDGDRLKHQPRRVERGVLRMGETVLLLLEDVSPFTRGEVSVEGGMVIGPSLRRVLDLASRARREGQFLLIRGESGAGKELVAKTFHEAKKSGRPVSFNCATIRPELAEATLFGTVKGAFTNAVDSEGLFGEANGSVLFLDEIAELNLEVQAKLLRTVETGEVRRVGDSKTRKVDVTLVAASHRQLKSLVKKGTFRDDLYFRLAQFPVELPPLRERPEEIPWLVKLALEERKQTIDSSFVEEVLLRYWPGNVRELISATRAAATRADGGALKANHLAEDAGLAPETIESEPETEGVPRTRPDQVTSEMIVKAMEACGGNATEAAKRLGLHRTQLSRLRKKFGLS